jgi:exodeoxyribonuclease-3
VKLATWNVNSIRARLAVVTEWLDQAALDVCCLQELRCTEAQFPAFELESRGYECVIAGQKARNGVAILARDTAHPSAVGFDNGFDRDNARLVSAEVSGVTIMSVYVPNGQSPELPAFEYKRDFFRELRALLERCYDPQMPLVIAGDFNVAPADADVYDPQLLRGSVCFHPDEQADFEHLLAWGLVDLYRHLHPQGNAYSWWDYRSGDFPNDRGMRLDHLLVTKPLAAACTACTIDREPRAWNKPSDHTPVVAEFARDP